MGFNEAKNLIGQVLENQRMTVREHGQVQEAWKTILTLAMRGIDNGDDAVHVPDPVQPSQ